MHDLSAVLTPGSRARLALDHKCRAQLADGAVPNGSFLGPAGWTTFSSGGLALMRQYRCLFYARVWKAGNDAIMESLLSLSGVLQDHRAHKAISLVATHISASNQEELRSGGLCKGGSLTFTFVREPLAHFVSGFGEFWYRNENASRACRTEDARNVLHTLLQQRFPRSKFPGAPAHMSLMAGVASDWKLDFVGTLENVEEDWERLVGVSKLLMPGSILNASLGSHPSSSDPQGARQSMASLLRVEPRLRHALCGLLAPDYVCFGYALQACYNGSALTTTHAVPPPLEAHILRPHTHAP
mmetsp:Transcript_29088/g.68066  ORF Transcript_29088/g.68066 Transcript_29088/m.68066 type:complete len:299 (-) Transcript_29088:23-919(-)